MPAQILLILNLVYSPASNSLVEVPLTYRVCALPGVRTDQVLFYDTTLNECALSDRSNAPKMGGVVDFRQIKFLFTKQPPCAAVSTRSFGLLDCLKDIKPPLSSNGCPISTNRVTWVKIEGQECFRYNTER